MVPPHPDVLARVAAPALSDEMTAVELIGEIRVERKKLLKYIKDARDADNLAVTMVASVHGAMGVPGDAAIGSPEHVLLMHQRLVCCQMGYQNAARHAYRIEDLHAWLWHHKEAMDAAVAHADAALSDAQNAYDDAHNEVKTATDKAARDGACVRRARAKEARGYAEKAQTDAKKAGKEFEGFLQKAAKGVKGDWGFAENRKVALDQADTAYAEAVAAFEAAGGGLLPDVPAGWNGGPADLAALGWQPAWDPDAAAAAGLLLGGAAPGDVPPAGADDDGMAPPGAAAGNMADAAAGEQAWL